MLNSKIKHIKHTLPSTCNDSYSTANKEINTIKAAKQQSYTLENAI